MNRLAFLEAARKARTHLGGVAFNRRFDVGAVLQVPRILSRHSIDQTGIGGTHDVAVLGRTRTNEKISHRWAEAV